MRIELVDYRVYDGLEWHGAFTVWPSLIFVSSGIWLDWLFWSLRISFKKKRE